MGMIIYYSFEEDFAEVKRGLFCRVLWFLILIPFRYIVTLFIILFAEYKEISF